MGNEIELYGSTALAIAEKRGNYVVPGQLGGADVTLVRDVDFGKIPKTKQPSLYKAGAEKICTAFGVFQRYEIESKIESADPPSFTYVVKCSLIKIDPKNGNEWVLATGYGAGSTNEKRNGFNGAFDALNGTIKMCQKRALVSAAISLGGLSGMFSQDLENDTFMAKADDLKENLGDEAPISAKQVKRIFALAQEAGYSTEEAKNKFATMGYPSTRDIKVKDYDKVCALFIGEKQVKE